MGRTFCTSAPGIVVGNGATIMNKFLKRIGVENRDGGVQLFGQLQVSADVCTQLDAAHVDWPISPSAESVLLTVKKLAAKLQNEHEAIEHLFVTGDADKGFLIDFGVFVSDGTIDEITESIFGAFEFYMNFLPIYIESMTQVIDETRAKHGF